MPGHSLKFAPLLPSAVPFLESPFKLEQGKGHKVRKSRTPSKAHSSKNKKEDNVMDDLGSLVKFQAKMTFASNYARTRTTLAMASDQEKKIGAFIPLSQTIAESVIAVQRSLLLSLTAKQSSNY